MAKALNNVDLLNLLAEVDQELAGSGWPICSPYNIDSRGNAMREFPFKVVA